MVIILMGVSGSGKTTVGRLLANELNWPYFDGDDFHSMKNIEKMSEGIALIDQDRLLWLKQISLHIKKLIDTKQSAVISCSALKQDYRKQLDINPEHTQFVYLKGSKDLIRQRLESRSGHFMKTELLVSQFDSLEEPINALSVEIKHSPEQISKKIKAHFDLGARIK